MSTFAEEYDILEEQWKSGKRDIQVTRKLLFINWYVFVESSVSGMWKAPPYLKQIWPELLSIVETSAQNDLESALVLGHMIQIYPFYFGDEDEWLRKSQTLYEIAYRIAEEQNRTTNELSMIGCFLASAIENVKRNQSSGCVEDDEESEVDESFFDEENYGYFTDMFLGTSEYDRYFGWIFGCK